MRLSHKLKKLTDPRTARSAKQHVGRIFLTRRFVFRLDAEKIIASINRPEFQAIYERYAAENSGEGWRKYVDLKKWIAISLQRVDELELDWGRRKHVLDIGSGAGYFLYICRWLGHDTLGLDINDVPMYAEMFRLLGLRRVLWRVESFQPLPAFDRKFDLITAFMICFNGHKSPALWGPKEWSFFFDDLETRLNPGGRIWLGLNRENDGTFYTEELRRFFVQRGAHIDEHRVILRPLLDPSRASRR
jgi:SAM-dependent methyltransferase